MIRRLKWLGLCGSTFVAWAAIGYLFAWAATR